MQWVLDGSESQYGHHYILIFFKYYYNYAVTIFGIVFNRRNSQYPTPVCLDAALPNSIFQPLFYFVAEFSISATAFSNSILCLDAHFVCSPALLILYVFICLRQLSIMFRYSHRHIYLLSPFLCFLFVCASSFFMFAQYVAARFQALCHNIP